jgi:hypothetical protein
VKGMGTEIAENVVIRTAENTVTGTVVSTKSGIKWIANDIFRGHATGFSARSRCKVSIA